MSLMISEKNEKKKSTPVLELLFAMISLNRVTPGIITMHISRMKLWRGWGLKNWLHKLVFENGHNFIQRRW